MRNSNVNILTRRSFLGHSAKVGIAAAIASLVDIPFVMKRALAEGTIGLNGKKVLFIWLRGANDCLNSVIPAGDAQYGTGIRPTLAVTAGTAWQSNTGGAEFIPSGAGATFGTTALGLGNGYAALHPMLKFLAPVYNDGELALIHRVAYPKLSRSHFDSQRYWENGMPNNNLIKDGIFYRTIIESGLANTAPLTGVSIQSSLPLILRGSDAAMTNLSDPTRYNLLGIPTPAGDAKADAALAAAGGYPFPSKLNRNLLSLQYGNLQSTLSLFDAMDFGEYPSSNGPGNYYQDNVKTDGDATWTAPASTFGDSSKGYFLFPTTNDKNGGWRRPDNSTVGNKYVVDPSHESFFANLKAAAMVLNNTDAIIAGTEIGGFDTHANQGQTTGSHPNLQRVIGWSMYALKKYFTLYNNKATWNDVVVVTLSEFGRTTVENNDKGTDHAESGVMFVAGGPVNGYDLNTNRSGVFNCKDTEFSDPPSSTDFKNWLRATDSRSAMFGTTNGYLRRNTDYRSVLGEIIRKHLGATQNQLNNIIPAYATAGEHLLTAGVSSVDGTWVRGEVGIL
ncbi:MAG TPA: DUF1501 domain-containing protein [Verrucomicrobiae bacterium]|nr:DUF1501 domain-containing protein [Verrucomicrobiae bacterium]